MPKKTSEELKKQFVELYHAGQSVQCICKEYNVSKSSLYNWIRLYSKIKTKGKLIFTGRKVYLLQKEVELLKEENEILKNCACSIHSPISLKVQEIKKLSKKYSIHALSRAFEIQRSVLYYHLNYRHSETLYECEDEKVKSLIKRVFEESRNRFGSRMIRAKLIEQGIQVSQERIARVMK